MSRKPTPKYLTEIRPFDQLKPGDLVGVSYGFVALERVEFTPDGRVTLHLFGQQPISYHTSNWPEVATGLYPQTPTK